MRDKHVLALLHTAMTLNLCDALPDVENQTSRLTLILSQRRLTVGFDCDEQRTDFSWSEQGDSGDVCFSAQNDHIRCQNGKTIVIFEQRPRDLIAHQAMFAVALWLNFEIEDAVVLASAYSVILARTKENLGCWPISVEDFPTLEPKFSSSFKSLPVEDHALYPVVPDLIWLQRCAKAQLPIAQLRIKTAESETALSQTLCQAVASYPRLMVNDHWALAIQHRAFGVHLGQEDLDSADLNAIAKANLRLGISTHGYYEILRAMLYRPSYIALGHIFPTPTKQMPSRPQGLAKLALYQDLIGDSIPTFAIGGIDLSSACSVFQCGVSGIAAVRESMISEDMKSTWQSFANEKQRAFSC